MNGWLAAALIAGMFDLGSTLDNLHHGCHEVSPLATGLHVTTPLRISVIRGGAMVSMVWFDHTNRREHPTMMNVIEGSMAAADAAAGLHNVRLKCGGVK